jgi:hypothetical protein
MSFIAFRAGCQKVETRRLRLSGSVPFAVPAAAHMLEKNSTVQSLSRL